jgi:hypothetical protein
LQQIENKIRWLVRSGAGKMALKKVFGDSVLQCTTLKMLKEFIPIHSAQEAWKKAVDAEANDIKYKEDAERAYLQELEKMMQIRVILHHINFTLPIFYSILEQVHMEKTQLLRDRMARNTISPLQSPYARQVPSHYLPFLVNIQPLFSFS